MLNPQKYLELLKSGGVNFFTGVPDSLLKDFCACLNENTDSESHIIAANEGAAIGLAIGHQLGSGGVPLVYMQNSGLGNIVNPILSLASPEVYSVPMLLMIGWRGQPGIKDEPQHIHQGRVMIDMLHAMDIPSIILSDDPTTAAQQTKKALIEALQNNRPIALIAIKGLFKSYKANGPMSEKNMTRESAIIEVASLLEDDAVVVSTTGMASRELFEYRSSIDAGHERDFLTVGGMGHANQIALGIAISQPKRKIYCFDGDGAAIMHMGSMGIVGQSGCKNFTHIVFNNGAHGSVGGQPTIGLDINFCKIAAACGYVQADRVEAFQEIRKIFNVHQHMCGPTFIEICVSAINKKDIGRPSSTPLENKLELINYLSINT